MNLVLFYDIFNNIYSYNVYYLLFYNNHICYYNCVCVYMYGRYKFVVTRLVLLMLQVDGNTIT